MGVVRELPAPGRQDTEKTREVRPDETRVCGQPLDGHGRRLQQGVVREALMRAEEGTQGLRDRAGEEEVRSRKLLLEVVCEPLLGCMLLTLGTVAVATGRMDAVVSPTAGALREAMSIGSALTVLDGADDLAM